MVHPTNSIMKFKLQKGSWSHEHPCHIEKHSCYASLKGKKIKTHSYSYVPEETHTFTQETN